MSERAPSAAAGELPDKASILAAIATLRLALDQVEKALAEVLPAAVVEAAAPASAAPPKWITMGKASEIGKCSIETMTKHVIKNGLGVKPAGGQWRVDELRVCAWREGKPFEPLIPYPTE